MREEQRAELEELRRLVEIERQEERRQYLEVIQKLPLKERVRKGYCWHPLRVVKQGYTIGERPFLLLERDGEAEHRFRAGMSVDLFTQRTDVRQPRKAGVIKYVKKNRMQLILNGSDAPDWINESQLGVDLMFDERTYREMDRALGQVIDARDNRLAELRDVIMGVQPANFAKRNWTSAGLTLDGIPTEVQLDPLLNASQQAAVVDVIAAQDLAIIHGPPGTGKTTTIVAAVEQLVMRGEQVLVVAPSNAAADLVCLRLGQKGLKIARVGNISRVEEEVLQHTLEVQLAQHPDTKEIKKLRREAAELRRKAQRWKRGPGGGKEKGLLFRDAGRLSSWARQLEDRLLDYVLSSSQVVISTLVGAASSILSGYEFPSCIIDEAAQALEPACWIPICKSNRVVLAGDPYQLPPTVKSRQAEKEGLNITLLEKCIERLPDPRLLEVQYRMNERIMGFSNQQFYQSRLKADASVIQQTLPNYQLQESVQILDTAGTGFEESLNERFQSRYNESEITLVIEHLIELVGSIPPEYELPSIAIISPYREQVVRMRDIFETEARFAQLSITIDTIDGFQGQERDVVYISLVRSNLKAEIGFLKDYRRMNVALTRARKQLVIIGDSATIGIDNFYADLLTYIEKEGKYDSAFSYIRN